MQRPLHVCFKLLIQRKVRLASRMRVQTRHDCLETTLLQLSPSRLLYVADKQNRCNYSIDTGAAVSVLPRSCANETVDTDSLPCVAANNSTITTYSTCKRTVDVGLKREYSCLLLDIYCDMRTELAIQATLSSIKPLSLNRIDSTRNEYTELLNQFSELTRPTTVARP